MIRLRRESIALVLAAATSLVASCRWWPASAKDDTSRPWLGGQLASDPDLESVLKPDVPVDRSGLYRGSDRRIYYVARLTKTPSQEYIPRYRKLIESRGLFVQSNTGNIHMIPPRVLAYTFRAFKKGSVRPYTLRYKIFSDTDEAFLNQHRLRSLPEPYMLEDDELVLRLGTGALQPWSETVLIPDTDVAQVKELPFARFAGAVLTRTRAPNTDDAMMARPWVARWYVVRGASDHTLLEHYLRSIRALGIPIEPSPGGSDAIEWWATERPSLGIRRIEVRTRQLELLEGSGLVIDPFRERAPALFADFPSDANAFSVSIDYATPEAALPYWTPAEQAHALRLIEGRKSGSE